MLQIRKSATRGLAEHGWLSSRHTFSFARTTTTPATSASARCVVINEDKVIGGQGFGTHGHSNMEIISTLGGALEHKDSMGTGSVLRYGDVQRMSAGSGVTHSEFNHSADETVHFLQIWIFPDSENITRPTRRPTSAGQQARPLRLIASPDGADGSLRIHQDARIFATILDGGQKLHHALGNGRGAYVQVARGQLQVNGITLEAGDALQVSDEAQLTLENGNDAEVLVFDLPL
jgi:redox-sensitive bicupin YhaK (pirin superfamily)